MKFLNDKNADADIKEIATNEFNSLKEILIILKEKFNLHYYPRIKMIQEM